MKRKIVSLAIALIAVLCFSFTAIAETKFTTDKFTSNDIVQAKASPVTPAAVPSPGDIPMVKFAEVQIISFSRNTAAGGQKSGTFRSLRNRTPLTLTETAINIDVGYTEQTRLRSKAGTNFPIDKTLSERPIARGAVGKFEPRI